MSDPLTNSTHRSWSEEETFGSYVPSRQGELFADVRTEFDEDNGSYSGSEYSGSEDESSEDEEAEGIAPSAKAKGKQKDNGEAEQPVDKDFE